MKKDRLKIITLSVTLILLLTITPTFFGSAKKIDETKTSNLLKTRCFKIEPTIKRYQNNIFKTSFSSSNDDLLVANNTGNESKPSIAINGKEVRVAYNYEQGGAFGVIVKKSPDYGANWSNFIDSYNNAISPSFTDIKYGGDFFGTFLSTENSSYLYEVADSGDALELDYSDITDPDGKFFDFETTDVCSGPNRTVNWIIGTIGDSFFEENEELNCVDSPLFFYKDAGNPGDTRTIVFFPEITGCNNISIKPGEDDEEEYMVYGVCEFFNDSKNKLLFFNGNPNIWNTEDLLRKQIFVHSEDLFHPQIFTDENNIYIVTETESNEIKLFHSSDYGEEGSWNLYNVTNEVASDPRIFVKNNGDVLCTFIKSNNLYRTESGNNGLDWSEHEKINSNNDTVVEGYKNTDIGDSNRIIWTDDREGDNTDLYMYLNFNPLVDLNLVSISITKDRPFLPTNNYISVTVRNDGNVVTTKDISVNISYEREDGNKTYIDYPFIIADRLSPGEEVTRKRPMFRFSYPEYFISFINFAGITNITVCIDPENAIDDSNLDNNVKKIDVDYEDIFPRIGKHKSLEIILQIISLLLDLILS